MSNVPLGDPGAYLVLELPAQVGRLACPKNVFAICGSIAQDFDANRSTFRGVALREHCQSDALERHWRFIFTDLGAVPQDVGSSIGRDLADDRDPCFMLGFDVEKSLLGIVGQLININEL